VFLHGVLFPFQHIARFELLERAVCKRMEEMKEGSAARRPGSLSGPGGFALIMHLAFTFSLMLRNLFPGPRWLVNLK
jgi:hypothetical protein